MKKTNRWDFRIEVVKTAGRVVMLGMIMILAPAALRIGPEKLLSFVLAA